MEEEHEVNIEDIPEVVIYIRKKNFEIRDVAVLAVDSNKRKVAAAGRKALEYVKEHDEANLFLPFIKGRISDVSGAVDLIKYLLKENGMGSRLLFQPKILAAVPAKLNEVERKAYEDTLLSISSKKGSVVESSIELVKASDEIKYDIAFGLIQNWLEEENKVEEINSIAIYSEDREMLLNEPLVIAVDKNTKGVAAAGREALQAKEIGYDNFEYICPFNNKKVAEFTYADKLINYYLHKAKSLVGWSIRRPNMVICNIPQNLTHVDECAYVNIFNQKGKNNIILAPVKYEEINKIINEGNKLPMKIKFYIELK